MRSNLYKIFEASIWFALAFAISCSGGDGKDDGNDQNSPSGGGGLSSCEQGTVPIGDQVWQKCNSDIVPSKGVYKCYGNVPANCTKYGKLYDWEAAKSACPSGFHLPNDYEWDILRGFVESDNNCRDDDYKCYGKHLKAESGWNEGGNGFNSYGFSALPGGFGASNGSFYRIGDNGGWWSASENDKSLAYSEIMLYGIENAGWFSFGSDLDPVKDGLFSVRCLKDTD